MISIPQFRPHSFLRNPHLQTIGAWLFHAKPSPYQAKQHMINVNDGDRIVLHDDIPAAWHQQHQTVLLVHGLGGDHLSSYMQRIAAKLTAAGVRTFRKDLRGCGTGIGLARLPYHSGRSEDIAAALRFIKSLCPHSPLTLIGFSLGGNMVLKYLGEAGKDAAGFVHNALVVCPPIDLSLCAHRLRLLQNRVYEYYFVKRLLALVTARNKLVPAAPMVDFTKKPGSIIEFDDSYVAPVCGFGTAENYYRTCSSLPFIPAISIPTLIITSRDDPIVSFKSFERVFLPRPVILCATDQGGHMGFIAHQNGDPDNRWLDWRIKAWVEMG